MPPNLVLLPPRIIGPPTAMSASPLSLSSFLPVADVVPPVDGLTIGSHSIHVMAGLLTAVLLLASCLLQWYRHHVHILSALPQPPSFPLIGHLLHIKRATIHEYLAEQTRRFGYGKNFGLWLGTLPTVVVTDPRDLHYILVKGQQHFVKGHSMKRIIGSVNPHSMFITEGAEWKAQRAAFNPAFHYTAVRESQAFSIQYTTDLCHQLEECSLHGTLADMTPLFESVVLNILGEFSFGYRFDALHDAPFRHAIKASLKHASHIYDPFRRLRLAAWKTGTQAIQFVSDKVRRVREARIKTGVEDSATDVMSILIRAEQSGAEWMTKYTNGDSWFQYRDSIMSIMFGGGDTTASVMCTAVYLLARHPDKRAKVQAELDACSIDPHSHPKGHEAAGLPYLNAVLKECMRVRPPAGFVGRRSDVAMMLPSGTRIHSGINLIAVWRLVHTNPLIWGEDAACFRPERWLEEDMHTIRKQPHVDASLPLAAVYMPFGVGARNCVGQQFARLEMLTVLAMVLRRFELSLPDEAANDEPLFLTSVATTYQHGLPLQVALRYQPKPAASTKKSEC